MAGYINQGGETVLQLDDGSTVKVVAIVPTSGGLAVALTPDQLAALTPPENPIEFPLPTAQFNALKPLANPTEFPLPTAQFNALIPPVNPTEFPLPSAQSGWLQGLRDRVLSFVRGSGDYTADTLRVVVAANQPEIAVASPGAKMTPINISGAPGATILTPTAGKRLRISALQLQSIAPTKIRLVGGSVSMSDLLEIEQFSETFSEPIVLAVGEAFKIDVDASTANAVGGYIVWREV
jgi:hypothetical protein